MSVDSVNCRLQFCAQLGVFFVCHHNDYCNLCNGNLCMLANGNSHSSVLSGLMIRHECAVSKCQ